MKMFYVGNKIIFIASNTDIWTTKNERIQNLIIRNNQLKYPNICTS